MDAVGIAISSLLIAFALTATLSGQGSFQTIDKVDPSLRTFLQKETDDSLGAPDKSVKATVASFNAGARRETVVYLQGKGWCGSGGCTMLVLESHGSSYRKIGDISIVRLPIRLSSHISHGMPDLEVHVQGGGIIRGYDAALQFNGIEYPDNPTVVPAIKLRKPSTARTLITVDDLAEPLY